MFCQFEYLRHCLRQCIRRALDVLPETLDETYDRMLEEIGKQNWECAHRLFQCVAAASRPLRVEELAEFLAFDFDSEPTPILREDWREEDADNAVRSTCSSLLTIVNVDGSAVVQFAHYSVKEYLTSKRLAAARETISRFFVSMIPAHTIVAQACLGVLLHISDNITDDRRETFPLAAYAAEHWVRHVRFGGVSPSIQDALERLFDPNSRHLAVWIQIYDPGSPRRRLDASHCPSQSMGTPLHYAAILGLHSTAKFLIVERSQNVNARGFDRNETPLCVASRWGHTEVAWVLLEHGVDTEIRDKDYWSPLDRASENGHVEIVRVLLEHGAVVNSRDITDYTALHTSAWYGQSAVTRALLDHGADVNAKAKDNETPLHWATNEGVARILLEYGADPNAKDSYNCTPLQYALAKQHPDVAHLLRKHGAVEHGATVKAWDKRGATPLHTASENGQLADARALLESGADANAKGSDQETPLHCTSSEGVARILLSHRADLNAQDNYDRTPLHRAVERGCAEVAGVLLDNGANSNSGDSVERTPLHLASEAGYLDCVRLLLQRSSDIHTRDCWGLTPFEVASANHRHDVMQLLLEHGAVDHRTY